MIKTINLCKFACTLIIFVTLIFVSCTPKYLGSGSSLFLSNIKIPDEDIAKLKQTKTVFFYGQESGAQLDSLKKAVNQAWDFTPLIFAPHSSFDNYAGDPAYSYIGIEGISVGEKTPANPIYPNGPQNTQTIGVTYFLSLRLITKVSKKGKPSTKQLCRIELSSNVTTARYGDVHRRPEDIIEDLYEKGMFYNYSPVLLKAQLGAVNGDLKKSMAAGIAEEFKKDNLSQLLSTDTLYVPKRLLTSLNIFTGKEGEKKENVFENYKFKYRICSDSELFDIFVIQQRGRFLFEFVKSSGAKIVNVYDLRSKEVVYRNHTKFSYNIKEKDIERIQ